MSLHSAKLVDLGFGLRLKLGVQIKLASQSLVLAKSENPMWQWLRSIPAPSGN